MNKNTRNLLILAGVGAGAYYWFFMRPKTETGSYAGASGGGQAGGFTFPDLSNLPSILPTFSPTTATFAPSLLPIAQATQNVLNTVKSVSAPSTPQASGNYYGPTIYKQGVAYTPSPSSAVQFAGKVLMGQVSEQQKTAYYLGLPTSAINPNVGKLVSNPVKTTQPAQGMSIAPYLKTKKATDYFKV